MKFYTGIFKHMETRFMMPLIRNLIIFGVFIWFSFNELSKEVGHSQWPLYLKGRWDNTNQSADCIVALTECKMVNVLHNLQVPVAPTYSWLAHKHQDARILLSYTSATLRIYNINSKIWSHNIQHTKFYKIMDNCIRNQETTNWMPL